MSTVASVAQAGPIERGATPSTVASAGTAARASADAPTRTAANEALIRNAFDAWRAGTGGVFDLLHEDAVWTVGGDSPVSGTYRGKRDFMDNAVAPITARLATPIVPEVDHLVAQGDTVVAVWRGIARAHDGSTYTNHYAWHMVFDADGRIVRVVAFLDTWVLAALME
ncbi:nuclear transport factor 2 family protein [Luteimonas saliphila]|uniref:nuclear transport factor 2 family protein n=1 Tax=Luteimonas saliphila TaxID=2804919 RepID=UPI00192E0F5C|nr:nuclear transport factor 2 family protein [Luteimonas saliphila]